MYALTDYDYPLPEELIAQVPVSCRDQSRLMVLMRGGKAVLHYAFSDLTEFLQPGDVLVVNNTKVIPGRLFGRKETGGKIELLVLDYPGKTAMDRGQAFSEKTPKAVVCQCLVKAAKAPRAGTRIYFDQGLKGTVMGGEKGIHAVVFECPEGLDEVLERIGHVPLPPYIKRNGEAPSSNEDRASYQTVYAKKRGAVAAPTAGLHFSDRLLTALGKKGVDVVSLTLHVGYGTFLPVRVSDIRQHEIHSEWYALKAETATAINQAKAEGRRVIAVGTTSVRVLEFLADDDGRLRAGSGNCDVFIYPGFQFRIVDAMITNFHLPQSTLLMLVSAFAGRDFILDAYQEAIEKRYRFFSYGDAMFIC